MDSGVDLVVGHFSPIVSPTRRSPPASLGLSDLDGLMGQALSDLVTTFYFDLPSKELDSVGIPSFEFPTIPHLSSPPSSSEAGVDIFDAFPLGVTGL